MNLQCLTLPFFASLPSLNRADSSVLKGALSDDIFSTAERRLIIPKCPPGYVDITDGNAHWWSCAIGCPTEEPWVDDHCNCACFAPKKGLDGSANISSLFDESQGLPASPSPRSWLNTTYSSAVTNNTQSGVQTQLGSRPLSFFAEDKFTASQGNTGSPEEGNVGTGLIAGVVSITALVLLVLVISVVTFVWKSPQPKRPVVDGHLRSASKASTATIPRPSDTYKNEMAPPNPRLCWHLEAGTASLEDSGQFASTAGLTHAVSYGSPTIWNQLHASRELCKAEITSIDL